MADCRIVILGGGSGGLELAASLARTRGLAVTLVDRAGAHLWKPRLHEFAAGTVDSNLTEISFYMLGAMRGFRFEQGPVEAIDRAGRTVRLGPMPVGGEPVAGPRDIPFDLLVVALGGITPDFDTPGVAEHAVRLDARPDADQFRSRFVSLMLRAREIEAPTHVVIVGSGATGTELAAHLRLAERAFFDSGARRRALLQITILEAAPDLMPGAGRDLRQGVAERLDALDIEYRTDARVTEITEREVLTAEGTQMQADIAVWAAGLVGHPVLSDLADFDMDDAGRIRVDQHLRSTVSDEIFVLGDAASLTPEGADAPLPPTAQCASQQADYLAEALPKAAAGRRTGAFTFKDKGRLISLGQAGSVGLVGFRSPDDLLVQGQFATAAYKTLQRKHQWAVFGPVRGTIAIAADMMLPTRGPALKLHG